MLEVPHLRVENPCFDCPRETSHDVEACIGRMLAGVCFSEEAGDVRNYARQENIQAHEVHIRMVHKKQADLATNRHETPKYLL